MFDALVALPYNDANTDLTKSYSTIVIDSDRLLEET